jgi:U3 small nucleolar RNA-associated protein 23
MPLQPSVTEDTLQAALPPRALAWLLRSGTSSCKNIGACSHFRVQQTAKEKAPLPPSTFCRPTHAGEKNSEHFLIATQDRGLQRSVMRVPGGACVFASVNGVHLETPSALQQKQVKQVRVGP